MAHRLTLALHDIGFESFQLFISISLSTKMTVFDFYKCLVDINSVYFPDRNCGCRYNADSCKCQGQSQDHVAD